MRFYKSVCAVLGLVALFAQGAHASVPTTTEVVLGDWCRDYQKVRSFAEEKGIPVLVYWGSSGCAKCKKMDEALSEPAFIKWREERKIAMLYAKDTVSANATSVKVWAKSGIDSDTKKSVSLGDYPFMLIYWKDKNGVLKAEKRFVGRSGTMPVKGGKTHEQLIASVERYIAGYVAIFDDPWDPDDDTRAGAQAMTFTKFPQSQAHTLSASDTNDWFKFTVAPNSKGLVSFSDVTITKGVPLYQVFDDNAVMASESGNVANDKGFEFENATEAPTNIFLRVYYASGMDVEIAYTINYREYVPVSVWFESTDMTFNAAAGTFEIPVTRGGDDETLKETAKVTVSVDGTMDARYTLETTELDWAGVAEDTQNIIITSAPDNTWLGSQTFKLVLTPAADETVDPFNEAAVTLDPGAPKMGTISYTGYVVNGVTNNYSSSARPVVREGDIVTVLVSRTGGSNMAAQVGFTWPSNAGTGKTASWADTEEGVREVEIEMPRSPTFQATRALALTFTAVENAALPSQAAQRALTFNVRNEFLVGSLAAWVAQNKALPFTTTSDAWFETDNGNLRSRPVSGAAPAVMSATVTGPGVLKFADADGAATLALSIGNKNVAVQDDGDVYGYLIPAGKQTITLRASGAGFKELSDVAYIPLTAAVTAVAPRTGDVVQQGTVKLLWNAAGAEQLAGINGITNSFKVFVGATEKQMTEVADLAAGSTSYEMARGAGDFAWRVAISVKDEGGMAIPFSGAVQKVSAVGAGAPNFDMDAGDFTGSGWVFDADAAQLTASTFVGVRTAFGPFPVANATGVKVKSGSLPKGMSLTQADGAWWVSGFPTKDAKNVRVVLQAMNGKAAGVTFALVYTILPLPQEATGTFDGVATVLIASVVPTQENYGTVTLTVSASGKISGKIVTQPKTYAFSAAGFDAAEGGKFSLTNAQFTARFKKETPIPLELELDLGDGLGWALLRTPSGKEGAEYVQGAYLARDGWADKALASEREAALRLALNYESGLLSKAPGGYYTIALPLSEHFRDNGLDGTGYLTVTVDKKGKVKAAGKLADGTAVSMATALRLGENMEPYLNLYTAPKAYSGGCFLGGVAIDRELVTGRILANGVASWESRNPRATGVQGEGFYLILEPVGGWYATKDSLRQMYANADDGWFAEAQDWSVEVSANSKGTGFNALPSCKSPDNAPCLKLSVKMKTGVLSGSFSETVGSKKVTRKLQGVLTPTLTAVHGYEPEGFSGRGFFLLPQTAPYKYNKSDDFLLMLDCGCGD